METAQSDPPVSPVSPGLVLLDVNETLSDTAALGRVLAGLGAPEHLGPTWFASVLRDGFALTVAGAPAPFAAVAAAAARPLLAAHVGLSALDEAVERLVAALGTLPLHPDVAPGLAALAEAGTRLVALTNGSAEVASGLLERGGVREHVEDVLSVQGFGGAWKPAASAYAGACSVLGVDAGSAMLVAVHPWDVDGAARAGLRTAWVDRSSSAAWPVVFTAPGLTVGGLDGLADALAGGLSPRRA